MKSATFFSSQKYLLLLSLIFLLTSCAPNSQYRKDYELCKSTDIEKECSNSSVQVALNSVDPQKVDYLLGFVEFDDQGQFFDRGQIRSLEDLFLQEIQDQNLILVVFVHGWKHNAREGDENIRQFRKILAKLAEAENTLAQKPRRVAGIYLGWRGKSFHLGPLTNLTFWDRKNTAHKVGHGAVVEVLARLEGIRNIDHILDQDPRVNQGEPTRLVIVGHSFGGAVVYSALSQILMERFIDIEAKAKSPREFGDLVVLINPAFEAIRYAPLKKMADDRAYFDGQRPILAVLTSEADLATKIAFPLGRSFSTFWEKERNQEQETANKKTIGHFAPFQTHYLEWVSWSAEKKEIEVQVQADEVPSILAGARSKWQQGQPIPFPGSELRHLEKTHPLNPYLNIYVNKQIIQGHNEIYDDRLVEFLRHFILFSLESTRPEKGP